MTRWRPTLTSDGEGGWLRTLAGSGTDLYGGVRVHDAETHLTFRPDEDVQPEDIVLANGAYYRIMPPIVGMPGAPFHDATLENIERPIVP